VDLLSEFSPGDAPKRTTSHLATIVSCVLHLQDGMIRFPVDRNLEKFQLSTFVQFGQRAGNCNGGHPTPKTVESSQSCTNGHLPYFYHFIT